MSLDHPGKSHDEAVAVRKQHMPAPLSNPAAIWPSRAHKPMRPIAAVSCRSAASRFGEPGSGLDGGGKTG